MLKSRTEALEIFRSSGEKL